MRIFSLILIVLTVSCGQPEVQNKRTQHNPEIEELKRKITHLQIIADVFEDAAQRPPFADCEVETNPLARTICSIAQTAAQEQLSRIQEMFGEFAKSYQTAIFGADCAPTGGVGCPTAGSLSGRVDLIETQLASHTATIAAIQGDIADLQNDVAALDARLDQVESDLAQAKLDIDALEAADVVINGLITALDTRLDAVEDDIDAINDRLDDLESAVNPDFILKPVELCGTIAGAGPIYETVQLTASNKKLYAMRGNGGSRNLGLVKSYTGLTAPSSGTTLQNTNDQRMTLTTTIGSSTCNAIVVRRWNDGQDGLQICWHVSNWNHSHGNLVNLYNQVGRPSLTCVGDVVGSW